MSLFANKTVKIYQSRCQLRQSTVTAEIWCQCTVDCFFWSSTCSQTQIKRSRFREVNRNQCISKRFHMPWTNSLQINLPSMIAQQYCQHYRVNISNLSLLPFVENARLRFPKNFLFLRLIFIRKEIALFLALKLTIFMWSQLNLSLEKGFSILVLFMSKKDSLTWKNYYS